MIRQHDAQNSWKCHAELLQPPPQYTLNGKLTSEVIHKDQQFLALWVHRIGPYRPSLYAPRQEGPFQGPHILAKNECYSTSLC